MNELSTETKLFIIFVFFGIEFYKIYRICEIYRRLFLVIFIFKQKLEIVF